MTTTAQPARYILRSTNADGDGRDIALRQGVLAIGRAPTSDVPLSSRAVSREHARLEVTDQAVMIHDLNSSNGVFVNGERVSEAMLRPGDEILLGDVVLVLLAPDTGLDLEATVILRTETDPDLASIAIEPVRGVVPQELLNAPVLSERALIDAGVEVKVVEFAALGAGMGSFAFVDYLRNCGVPARDIAVIGIDEKPHARYERLCQNSQIPPHERLRSNSESRPDNVWGFPGYATSEIWRDLTHGRLKSAATTLWSIFGEPAIAQTYTPRSGDVFRALDREAARIGWQGVFRRGRIRAIRKSSEGRLLAIVSESDEHQRRHFAVSARFLHLSIGYPAIQLLPDLAEYRERYGDNTRVVNAYEPHEQVYQELRRKGGVVVVRGRGIVASRIIQRLYEERRRQSDIVIVHLHRSRLTSGHRLGLSRRRIENQAEFQPFNWPKSCWTGEQREVLEHSSPEKRAYLLDVWGGTTTANRRDWRRIIDTGLREGWYRSEFGVVKEVKPTADGRIVTHIQNSLAGGGTLDLTADFVVDCTGLIAAPDRSTPVGDMIKTYDVPLNPKGRIQVSNDFEIEAMRHGEARMYAAGATTLGGPHAAVDSFLGLQYAGFRAVNAIRPRSSGQVRRLSGLYSVRQWLKWVRGVAP